MMAALPAKYSYLNHVSTLPRVISEGLKFYGVREVKGAGWNAQIKAMASELEAAGVLKPGVYYSDDLVPWCGLFVAAVCLRAGKPVQPGPLWARNWLRYGKPTKRPRLGDILVFERGSGGHVGFYVGEDATRYYVLGGNQSDSVSIAPLDKSRLLGAQQVPFKSTMPASYKKYLLGNNGEVSSTNEV